MSSPDVKKNSRAFSHLCRKITDYAAYFGQQNDANLIIYQSYIFRLKILYVLHYLIFTGKYRRETSRIDTKNKKNPRGVRGYDFTNRLISQFRAGCDLR